jgi:hypothetical protein
MEDYIKIINGESLIFGLELKEVETKEVETKEVETKEDIIIKEVETFITEPKIKEETKKKK